MADTADSPHETLSTFESNERRLNALAARGLPVPPQQLNDLHILAFLEVLLGDALPRAEDHYTTRLAEQLDAIEVQADNLESELRRRQIAGGAIPPNGR